MVHSGVDFSIVSISMGSIHTIPIQNILSGLALEVLRYSERFSFDEEIIRSRITGVTVTQNNEFSLNLSHFRSTFNKSLNPLFQCLFA